MPERFLGNWPKDAFIPFSQGMSCPLQHCNQTHKHRKAPTHVWGDGARIVVELRVSRVLTNFFQILRDRGHRRRDYARVKI